MVKHLKEDIDGIRYCVISRNRERKFYDVEEFCDSSLEARKLAKEYADSDADHRIHDTEYWAFDTKKWKASLPTNFMKDDQTFDPNLPIYHNDENGKAELLADYIGRKVNDYTGRWKKESYKKPKGSVYTALKENNNIDYERELSRTIIKVGMLCDRLVNDLEVIKESYEQRVHEVIAHMDDLDESEIYDMYQLELNNKYGKLLHVLGKADRDINEAWNYINDIEEEDDL